MFETGKDSKYDEIMKAYLNNNATEVTKLEGQVSGGELGLNKGDIIEWPDKKRYLKIKMQNGRSAQAMLCKITNGDTYRYGLVYPRSFFKAIFEVEVDSEGRYVGPKPVIYPEGQPTKDLLAQNQCELDTVFNKFMEDHPNGIRVKDFTNVNVLKFGTQDVTTTRRYEYEYV